MRSLENDRNVISTPEDKGLSIVYRSMGQTKLLSTS